MYHGIVEGFERRWTAPMGDHGTVINIVSWILAVIALCTLIARFAMKFSIKDKTKRFGSDDLFILLAAFFSIGQTIAVSIESVQALGQHYDALSISQRKIFQKAEYVGCMLYMANMGCARISVCLLIKKVLPGQLAHFTALVFAIFTVLWTISGVLVTAFPCSLPNPWQFEGDKKCIDIIKWINYVGITNVVVEILLISIPLCVWNLRTSTGRRMSVSLVFVARLAVVAAVSAQLHYFNRYSLVPDMTYNYWRTVLCVQIAQNLSIITASLPCLHPFIIKVMSGVIKAEIVQFDCPPRRRFQEYILRKTGNSRFDPMSSQSSTLPMKEGDEYCRPLATYGLDRSSAQLNSQHFNRFPATTAKPALEPKPHEDVFMRCVEIPSSRPPTSRSSKALPEIPKTLSEVGVLPVIDWDTDSSTSRDSGRSNASRRPDSEYVFNRSKVISVPEESHLREDGGDGQYWKKYYPPLPSPKMPKKPPRL